MRRSCWPMGHRSYWPRGLSAGRCRNVSRAAIWCRGCLPNRGSRYACFCWGPRRAWLTRRRRTFGGNGGTWKSSERTARRWGLRTTPPRTHEYLAMVAAAAPELLVVGFGAPKQELWVHRHRRELAAKVVLCAGATIDFLAGHRRRSPVWMRRAGLEWVHRLVDGAASGWRAGTRATLGYSRSLCGGSGAVFRRDAGRAGRYIRLMPERSILVVAVDGLRAAALGAYGNTAFGTPALDQLAAESFLFDSCLAPAAELAPIYRALWQSVHPLRTDELH